MPRNSFPGRGSRVPTLLATLLVCSAAQAGEPRPLPRPVRGPATLATVERWTAPPLDVDRLRRDDDRDRARPGLPRRVGHPMRVSLTPANSGSWEELAGGDRIWRLHLVVPGALWTVVGLDLFRLEAGARLFAYDGGEERVLGPFTSRDARAHGELWLPPIEGGSVVLEVEWPAGLRGRLPALRVGTVSHGYEAWGGSGEPAAGRGRAGGGSAAGGVGDCHVDVHCPAGDDWQDEQRGVVQLLSGGSAFCTGTLVNTTARDCRPYVLTAAHCAPGPSTTFRFGYERPGCESGLPPAERTLTGATLLASHGGSDFALLELDHEPPPNFEIFFNGWRRSPSTAMQSWTIHHPAGEVKKISHNADPLVTGQYWGPSHWLVTDWEVGATEGGSSGAPLFDPDGRLVGQLHGGTASCSAGGWDEFGKLSVSWASGATPQTRLGDWLDALATGESYVDGIDATACIAPGPELVYAGHSVDDSSGNGNGAIDPGESVLVTVRLANVGTLDASLVAGTLASTSSLAALGTGAGSWPTIAAGGEAFSSPPSFLLHVDPAWPCGEPIALVLGVSSAESPGGWNLPLALPTGSPGLLPPLVEDVEGASAGWTVALPTGFNPWSPSEMRSVSPSRSWFVGDLPEPSEALLVSPTLPALPAAAELRFEHWVATEAGRDGGVLEYSTDGTSWLDAGPLVAAGSYNGTIDPVTGSPLGGRPAWTGELAGWQTVAVDLSSLAGADVVLRWRFATDPTGGGEGWYVDDIRVTVGQCEAVLPLPPGEASAPGGVGSALKLAITDAGYALSWSAPPSGGPVADYALYSLPIAAPWGPPECESLLGSSTSAIVGSLGGDRAFLVVARNAQGEGSYGADSAGVPRAPATTTTCP